jgi:hypothetical protein
MIAADITPRRLPAFLRRTEGANGANSSVRFLLNRMFLRDHGEVRPEMELAFIDAGLEVGTPATTQAADLFVQFDSFDVLEDHFTIFWGGKRLDHAGRLAEFFMGAVHKLVHSNEKEPLYRAALYTDHQKVIYRSHLLDLHPSGLEGDIWFARFELLPSAHGQFSPDAPLPRFTAWGRIGDNADASSDSLGIWMIPPDFRAVRHNVSEFISETFPRYLRPGELDESLNVLAERVGVAA